MEFIMSTYLLQLTSSPVQISDGVSQTLIQSLSGSKFYFAASPTIPDQTAYHVSTEISVGAGFQLWAWCDEGSPVTLAISAATA